MKGLSALVLTGVASTVFAQMPPPGRGQGSSGPGMVLPANSNRASGATRSVRSSETETVRLLGLRNVQTELGITATQYRTLAGVARALSSTTSEDTALSAVSGVLNAMQATRLRELLVQDLGYNALALSAVRSTLGLTADQTTQISAVLAIVQLARQAASAAADPRLAERASAASMAQSSTALSKLLTAEQDTKLRSLAGRAIGTR